MILVVEDATADKENILDCIDIGCSQLRGYNGSRPIIEIALTEEQIEGCISKCSGSDEPLMLIIDLQINLKGQGRTKVVDIARDCWEQSGTYLSDVPIIIYSSLSTMDNIPARARGHGWRVGKNPPPGKTSNEEMQGAINEGLQGMFRRWNRL